MKKMWVVFIGIVMMGFFEAGTVNAEEQLMVIKKFSGEVYVKRAEAQEWQPATVAMTLHEGDQIKTGEDSRAEILLDRRGQSGVVVLKEESLMRIKTAQQDPKSHQEKTLLDLAIGRVIIFADRENKDSTFEVMTPTSTTGVRGTLFEVEVE